MPPGVENVTGALPALTTLGEMTWTTGKVALVVPLAVGVQLITAVNWLLNAKVRIPARPAKKTAHLLRPAGPVITPFPTSSPEVDGGVPPAHVLMVALISISSDVEVPVFVNAGMKCMTAGPHAAPQVIDPVAGFGIALAPLIGPASNATNSAELTTTNRRMTTPRFRRTLPPAYYARPGAHKALLNYVSNHVPSRFNTRWG